MNQQHTLIPIGIAVFLLALITALIGLLYQQHIDLPEIINARGQTVELYGQGIYAYDTIMIGAANRGTDLVVLIIGLPLLVYALKKFMKDEEKGLFLLAGVFAYFFYLYATFSLSIAYNRLFLLYIVIFGLSFFGLLLCLLSLSKVLFQKALKKQKTWIPYYMIIMGLVAGILWAIDPITTLLTGHIPTSVSLYPTLFTHAFDLAIVIPAAILSGILMKKEHPLGVIIAIPVLMIMTMLFPSILSSTYFQYQAGLIFTPQEIVGFIVSFLILGIFGFISLKQIYQSL